MNCTKIKKTILIAWCKYNTHYPDLSPKRRLYHYTPDSHIGQHNIHIMKQDRSRNFTESYVSTRIFRVRRKTAHHQIRCFGSVTSNLLICSFFSYAKDMHRVLKKPLQQSLKLHFYYKNILLLIFRIFHIWVYPFLIVNLCGMVNAY
jgi:hypothetical protein